MGSAKSKIKNRREEKSPRRFFLDNIAIDLDSLRAATLTEDLSQDVYYIHYEMSNNDNWYEGSSSTDKQVIEKRLALVLSALNSWTLHKISLTMKNQPNRDKIIG